MEDLLDSKNDIQLFVSQPTQVHIQWMIKIL